MRRELMCLGLMAGLWVALITPALHADVADGLIGYWPLNEGTGDVTVDQSEGGHDGTLMGGALWSGGLYGNALSFDGVDDYVLCAERQGDAPGEYPEDLMPDVFSVSCWANLTSFAYFSSFIGNGMDTGGDECGFFLYNFGWVDDNEQDFGLAIRTETGMHYVETPNIYQTDTWYHLAATFDGTEANVYVNGELAAGQAVGGPMRWISSESGFHPERFAIGVWLDPGYDLWVDGTIDDVAYWNRALTAGEITDIATSGQSIISQRGATRPQPEDGTDDVLRDVSLEWTPGKFAVQHAVHVGENFSDVNEAGIDDALSVQDANTYDLGVLDFGRTYYWRVDEVNGPPDNTVFTGDVWSFTVEPLSIPLDVVAVTASSSHNDDMAPTKTIDGSGLNEQDQHSTEPKDMWLSGTGGDSAWIQYEFDNTYKLHEIWIWNSNQMVESFVGLGAKDVTIETSTDGVTWAVLADVAPLAQAPGTEGYAHNNTIDFAGAMARYVRLTINSGYGVLPQYGISEVRFFYVPTYAREAQPAPGATTAGVDVVLSWRAGREAAVHEVCFGPDSDAVANGTAVVGTVSEPRFDLADQGVEFGETYFWKVNEVNEAGSPTSYSGDLWSFSTPEYAVVDNFDQYDNDCARIFFTWLDGLGHNGSEDCAVNPYDGNLTGSIVGHASAPFAERDTVVSGQSMPLDYDNSFAPYYSEAESVAFALPQDWAKGGADTLTLSVRGYPAKFEEDSATGMITMSGAGDDIWGTSDEFRFAYQRLNGDGSLAVKVESLLDTDPWAKAGVMIRETLDAEAKHAMTVVTPGNGVSFQRRTAMSSDSESTDQAGGLTAPYWVKITRSGDSFTAQSSADGATWDTIDSVNISMVPNVYIGLALTSHSPGNATVAEFTNITRTGPVTGAWQTEDVGVDQPANEAAPLYIALEDSANKIQVIEHPDAAAVLAPTWQKWSIPLSDLDAVDLAHVKRLYIGVGDRNSPQAGGVGKLFIDNILVGKPAPVPVDPPAQVFTNTDFEANADLVPNAGDIAASAPDGWEYDRYYGYDIDPWLANVSDVGDGSGGDVAVALGTWNGDSAWHPVVAAYDQTPVVPAAYTLDLTVAATGGAGDRSLSQGRVEVQFGWLEDPADPWSNYGELVRAWTDVTAEFGTDTWGTKTWNFEVSPNDEAVGRNWYLWLRGESYDDHVLIGGVSVTPVLE